MLDVESRVHSDILAMYVALLVRPPGDGPFAVFYERTRVSALAGLPCGRCVVLRSKAMADIIRRWQV